MPSTVVAHIAYDPKAGNLQITFVSGLVYVYKKVPEEVYRLLKTSGSKGSFLNHHIKGHFPFKRIK